MLFLSEHLQIVAVRVDHLNQFVFHCLNLIDFHLVGGDTLLDGVNWRPHLVGDCGVEHRGEIPLSNHVLVPLALRNVDKLHNLALLVILEQRRCL